MGEWNLTDEMAEQFRVDRPGEPERGERDLHRALARGVRFHRQLWIVDRGDVGDLSCRRSLLMPPEEEHSWRIAFWLQTRLDVRIV